MHVLESLEKSISEDAAGDAAETLHKENIAFKGQLEVLLRENAILKRAVAIQHERQKEYDARTVEVNNYALTMHLRQAQGNNSIPGRFHPDIF
ncbi:hypothetical protein L1987_14649 [Smallanthus sonchifolius]|uniref:Uncharacterized protein n=1 Tax=Smallanthus sonchifolius TaxID=185202 RepID=A0ACB9J482_9ASTR|nr:hypothetical protein L1987_14649 [Smallanthus sonchifolius]